MPRLLRILFTGAALAAMSLALLVFWQGRQTAPREHGRLPDFTLTERSGATVGLADLGGKVWIADFIFTRCGSTCPLMTAAMAELEEGLDPAAPVRLVTITVDPEHDTAAVLADFADRYGADPERWLFLSGDKRETYALIRDGFRLGVDEVGEAEAASVDGAAEPFIHSTRLVLVDGRGEIRGYYDATDKQALARLRGDLAYLLER